MGNKNTNTAKNQYVLNDPKRKKEHKILALGASMTGKTLLHSILKVFHSNSIDTFNHFEEKTRENLESYLNRYLKLLEIDNYLGITEVTSQNLTNIISQCQNNPQYQKVLFDKMMSGKLVDGVYDILTDDTIDVGDFKSYVTSYSQTVGVLELSFHSTDSNGKVVDIIFRDIGGRRTERKKWIHCFEDNSRIFYFVSLSDYNLTLLEDDVTNRMKENLQLWGEVINSRWFNDCKFLLIFNKPKSFEKKLNLFPFKDFFTEYNPKNNFEEEYIREMFLSKNQTNKPVFPFTVDLSDFEKVKEMMEMIMKEFDLKYDIDEIAMQYIQKKKHKTQKSLKNFIYKNGDFKFHFQ